MIHPAWALAVGSLVVLALVAVLWPDNGLLARWRRIRRASEHVLTEDALKHVFDFEYQDRACSLQSLAGALHISGQRAAELLARMQRFGLIAFKDGTYELTPQGRSDALRVIRIHRLWERYFSDETGIPPARWHDEAERLEHKTSEEQAEALSRRMGHPLYDPHGDPIPTAAGEILPRRGRSMVALEMDRLAEIVHIEDEPKEVFAQLVAEGLSPGMRVRVFEVTPERIRFEADAEEHVLAPIVAASLFVEPLPEELGMAGPFDRLSSLELGESGRVIGFLPACRGAERRRLLDLGLIAGTLVRAEIRSPGGDPTGYRIRGAVIALRRDQADFIQITRGSEMPPEMGTTDRDDSSYGGVAS